MSRISLFPQVYSSSTLLVYRVHWLRAKATKDRWTEEEEILKAEFQWTINFFQRKAEDWDRRSLCNQNTGLCGPASYAARQTAIYARLRDHCQMALESICPRRMVCRETGPC
ncbi:hypothetical protein L210DRAFT_3389124 [Boletus edulis BED1]|uniref:Uncharacterized protein n=1 Tax=Boletus edulis BED1 TaxID=1328754 RepID=A0AAD4GK23_BOLED|nr:hypothetical protein L210DRAFT_3389124 [Boletus edulis BED1]